MKNTTKNEGVISRLIFPTSRYIIYRPSKKDWENVRSSIRRGTFTIFSVFLCLTTDDDDDCDDEWKMEQDCNNTSYHKNNNETCLQSIELLPAWRQTLPTPLCQIGWLRRSMKWRRCAPMQFGCTLHAFRTNTQLESWKREPVNLSLHQSKNASGASGGRTGKIVCMRRNESTKRCLFRFIHVLVSWIIIDRREYTRTVHRSKLFYCPCKSTYDAVYFPCNIELLVI